MDLTGRRKNATRETTATLKAWLYEHRKNPYPTKSEKVYLAIITKMTLTQVSTWFANARRRLKKENKMTWSPRNRFLSSLLSSPLVSLSVLIGGMFVGRRKTRTRTATATRRTMPTKRPRSISIVPRLSTSNARQRTTVSLTSFPNSNRRLTVPPSQVGHLSSPSSPRPSSLLFV